MRNGNELLWPVFIHSQFLILRYPVSRFASRQFSTRQTRTVSPKALQFRRSADELIPKRCPVLVPMELARIIISELNDQQVIYLREVDGERMFPILIGLFEATSIDRRIKKDYPQRPLTHDLLKSSIHALGGEIQSVVISDLREHTYFAKLRVVRGGEVIDIDSRPSDAVALAVHYEPCLPIYVDSDVLDQVL